MLNGNLIRIINRNAVVVHFHLYIYHYGGIHRIRKLASKRIRYKLWWTRMWSMRLMRQAATLQSLRNGAPPMQLPQE